MLNSILGYFNPSTNDQKTENLNPVQIEEQERKERIISEIKPQDKIEHYYTFTDDFMFYKENDWKDFNNLKIGIKFKYPSNSNSDIVTMPGGVTSIQLKEKTKSTNYCLENVTAHEFLLETLNKMNRQNIPFTILEERAVKVNSKIAYEISCEVTSNQQQPNQQLTQQLTQQRQLQKEEFKFLTYLCGIKSNESNRIFILQFNTYDLNRDKFNKKIKNFIHHLLRSLEIFKPQSPGNFYVCKRDLGFIMQLCDSSFQSLKINEKTINFLPKHLQQNKILIYLLSNISKEKIGKEIALIELHDENTSFEELIEKVKEEKKRNKTIENFIELNEKIGFNNDKEELSDNEEEGRLFAYVSDADSIPMTTMQMSKIITSNNDKNNDDKNVISNISKQQLIQQQLQRQKQSSQLPTEQKLDRYNFIELYFRKKSKNYLIISRSHCSLSLTNFRQSIFEHLKTIKFISPLSITTDDTYLIYENNEFNFKFSQPIQQQASGRQPLTNNPVAQFIVRTGEQNMFEMAETSILFEALNGDSKTNQNILNNPTSRLEVLKKTVQVQIVKQYSRIIPYKKERKMKFGNIEAYNVVFSAPINALPNMVQKQMSGVTFMMTCFLVSKPSLKQGEDDIVYSVTIRTNILDQFYNENVEKLFVAMHCSFENK